MYIFWHANALFPYLFKEDNMSFLDSIGRVGEAATEGFSRTVRSNMGQAEVGELSTIDDIQPHHLEDIRDTLPLAQDVYNDQGSPPGYTRLDPGVLGDDVNLSNPDTGFDAALYQNQEGEVFLAFRGTDGGVDWQSNFNQGFGEELDRQYEQAIAVAERSKEVFGDDLKAITGHSLGGGLATTAGLSTGIPTYAYNGAGLSEQTQEILGDRVALNQDKIVNVNDSRDPLNNLNGHMQRETLGGESIGDIYWIGHDNKLDLNPLENHGLSNIAEQLQILL